MPNYCELPGVFLSTLPGTSPKKKLSMLSCLYFPHRVARYGRLQTTAVYRVAQLLTKESALRRYLRNGATVGGPS